MIITCEKCDTRFNLDDSRIPAEGVKVRCSRCTHAFFVEIGEAAGAGDGEAAADLARDAAAEAASNVGHGETQTLEDADERTQMLEQGSVDFSTHKRDDADEESDWEFNEDPEEEGLAPELGAAVELAEPREEAEAAPDADPMNEFLASETPPSETEGLSLDDLGSPEDWDLLGPEKLVSTEPETEPSPHPVEATAPEPAESVQELPVEAPPAVAAEEAPLASSRAVHTGVGLLSWGLVAVLLGLAAWGSLVPGPQAARHAAPAVFGDLRVDGIEARVVENAVAGPLHVVSGRLRNPGPSPSRTGARLHVQLLDGSGRALAAPPVPLVMSPSEVALRLDEPELLVARQGEDADILARTLLEPGESLEIVALLPPLPEGARSFRLELGPRVSSEASPPSPPPDSSPNPE